MAEAEDTPRMRALAIGAKTYTTDKPCKYGHVARYTSSAQCIDCHHRHDKRMRAIYAERDGVIARTNHAARCLTNADLVRALSTGAKTYLSGMPCKRGHPGLRYVKSGLCVECGRAHTRAANLRRNPAEREQYAAQKRDWMASSRGRHAMRESFLRRKYGITCADYDALLAAQGGTCAICHGTTVYVNRVSSNPTRHRPAKMYIDHCHTTGRIRGILCPPCNSVIGYARDNPETLERAAAYLRPAETR